MLSLPVEQQWRQGGYGDKYWQEADETTLWQLPGLTIHLATVQNANSLLLRTVPSVIIVGQGQLGLEGQGGKTIGPGSKVSNIGQVC